MLIKSLGLFFLFVCSYTAVAAQFALITTDRAVIYADQAMTAPIGFIRKGKKLKVGEIPRHRGKLLPVIISKKIAYIKIDDLALSHDPDRLEIIDQRKIRKDVKKESYQFSFHLDSQQTAMSTSQTIGGDKTKNMNMAGYSVKGHLSKAGSQKDFRVGMEYTSGGDGDDEFLRMFTIYPEIFFSFNKSEKYHLGVLAAAYFSPYTQYELSPLFKVNGQAYGFSVGPSVSFALAEKFKGELSLQYRSMFLYGFNLPEGLSTESISPTLSGTMLSLGISYSY